MRSPRVAFLSTYPPTRCGLATFTQHLYRAMAVARGEHGRLGIVQLVDEPTRHPHREVVAQHVRGRSPLLALRSIAGYDALILQHEYGIFGGRDGSEAIDIVRSAPMPVIVVLHTVLTHPTLHQRQTLEALADEAVGVLVLSEASRSRLRTRYRIDPTRVSVIPHGATTFGWGGEPDGRTILTWGLLGPGKGIEWAIDALALIGDVSIRYVVAGQTHPNVQRATGEGYRRSLQERARARGVDGAVEFVDAYVGQRVLRSFIRRASGVLLPYESTEQVSSGVLVEALSAGRPVVATRFPQAVELLSSGAGLLVHHRDPEDIAVALKRLLSEPGLAARLTAAARRLAPLFSWDAVAARYEAAVRMAVGLSVEEVA